MDISMQVLRIFCRVADLGSFTQTAREFYFTEPHVSTQMAKLQRNLGLALFDHLGKHVYLTAAGEAFYRHAQQMLQLADETDRAVSELRGEDGGQLRVGASVTIATSILPITLSEFRCQRERVQITLEAGNATRIAEGVVQNRLDFGFAGGPLDRPELESYPLFPSKLVLIVGHQHPWWRVAEVAPGDLAEQQFIGREKGSALRLVSERELSRHGLHPKVTMEMNNTEAVKLAVAYGAGVAFVPEYAVVSKLSPNSLHIVQVGGLDLQCQIVVFCHKDKHRTHIMNAFLSFAQEHFSHRPGASKGRRGVAAR